MWEQALLFDDFVAFMANPIFYDEHSDLLNPRLWKTLMPVFVFKRFDYYAI